MSRHLQCGRYRLSLERPLVMGVVNITPDSFSDGDAFFSPDAARDHAWKLLEEGADILDFGAESTRPGSSGVSVAEELHRLVPVLEPLMDCGVPLSVDTRKAQVMHEVLALGVDMINDVAGFREADTVAAVAAGRSGLCLMHMQNEPRTMQVQPQYNDVVADIHDYLITGAKRLEQAGVAADRIVLDPGFGFGKTAAHNYALLRNLRQVLDGSYVGMVGLSRKSMIAAVTGRPVRQRLGASVALALAAVLRGADIVRVHDVADTVDALRLWATLEREHT